MAKDLKPGDTANSIPTDEPEMIAADDPQKVQKLAQFGHGAENDEPPKEE